MPQSEEAQLADLDAAALHVATDGTPSYVVRCDAYAAVMPLLEGGAPSASAAKTAGLDALRESAGKYVGHLRQEFNNAIRVLIEVASTNGGKGP
jgi:hypothetical protein